MMICATAFILAGYLDRQDVVWLCDDDQQAEALAAALAALVPDCPVICLPSSDALPGDRAPASPGNIGRRMAALRHLASVQADRHRPHVACILSGEAAAQCYPAPATLKSALPRLVAGDALDAPGLAQALAQIGYVTDDRVDEAGEYALRGEVVDIFPADADLPIRIDVADGRIAEIRTYDPVTQRRMEPRDAIEIGLACDLASTPCITILDHLADAALGLTSQADRRRQRYVKLAQDAQQRAGGALHAIGDPVWAQALQGRNLLSCDQTWVAVPRFVETHAPLAACVRFIRAALEAERTVLLVGGARDLRFLAPRLARRLKRAFASAAGLADVLALPPGSAAMLEMPVTTGFADDRITVIAAGDLLGSRALTEDETAPSTSLTVFSGEIRIGDVVVHEDHGVALIAGLDPAPDPVLGGRQEEMIALEYAAGARRLVPVGEGGKIWRYGADADGVALDTLNGSSWARRRAEIESALAASAGHFAALVKERATRAAPVIDPDAGAYEGFVSGFPFNETADQARAIRHVREDLTRGRPMDRLIVGDVGYGKTEVALRGAALTALAGYQVVVAAPTTVLVRQHLETFGKRFADTGLRVAGLSRLSSAAEKKAVKAGLADGTIAIVVGTGAVMAKGVAFHKLGLVIIDEEQRFGTADKARLRGGEGTHLLSLSATPIPRSLQMALVGLQQISLITTPPARRQPIRTSLDQFDDGRVRAALLREQGRGGQSFVVVPRIEDMAGIAERLARIVPDLAIVQAHGKMPAAAMDTAMVGFAQGQGDVLLATNIIEAGLDIPRANTMIVWRADRFGLAQLHQLRGRVGRGNRRGQVLLLTDGAAVIADKTLKRLRTLGALDRLGAGFDISARDLDMRGGGDLLGDSQAGHMRLIGTDLYQHMLGRAMAQARGEKGEPWSPELHMGGAGCLPADWIPEVDLRLTLYIRLARAQDDTAIDALEAELIDRFGPLPEPAETLMAQGRIGALARRARIARIDAGPSAIAFTPRPDFARPDDAADIGLIVKDGRLLLPEATSDEQRIDRVQTVLEAMAS